jgi:subtilisin family serine protease
MKMFLRLSIFLLLSCTATFGQAEISSRLQKQLNESKPDDYLKVLIYLSDQVDLESLDAQLYLEKASPQTRAYKVITALQEKAASTQGPLINYFEEKLITRLVFSYKPFWVANFFMIEAKPEIIQELKNRSDILQLDVDALLDYDKPVSKGKGITEAIMGSEIGAKVVNADKLWKLGITGQGRLLMGIDTGVRSTHIALTERFRGNFVPMNQAWFDPGGGSTTPSDCDGHGTHTMGTMVGRTSSGDTVGLAIDAQWIAAKTICSSPHTSNSLAAFQWALNPDGNPNTISDMPDAIGNSWYDPNYNTLQCDTTSANLYRSTLSALEAAGIAVVFSAGNSGPNASTITAPKNINRDETNVYSVGAISSWSYLGGSTTPIASFSSRGPSLCGGIGSLLIKPEVSAPGVNVRSCIADNDNAYDTTYSGTSMACPHVVGAIGLLKQAFPTLTGKQIKLALYNTARDLGTAGEDNTYGKGLIDVYAAFLSLGIPDSVAPTKINNLSVTDPTSNSLSLQWTAPLDTSVGGVTQYDIRMASTPILDLAAFNAAQQLSYGQAPKPAGSSESFVVGNLGFSTTKHFAIRSRDTWGNWSLISNPASGTTLGAPDISVSPDSLKHALVNNMIVTDTVTISNISSGSSTLDYQITLQNNTFPSGSIKYHLIPKNLVNVPEVNDDKENPMEIFGQSIEGQGGPDAFGYKWIDSDAPGGPTYAWNDISSTGTLVSTWTATGTSTALDDGYAGPFPLGFNIKFYGENKNQVYISTNGLLHFGSVTANIYSNVQIPNSSIPNDFIAAFWDDLDGRTQGTVHYKQEPNKFIVQFTNWQKYSAAGSLTFQIVIHASGKIVVYYNNMNGTLTSSTVGIENSAGTVGLPVAYNSTYVKNNLALQFSAEPDWLSNIPTGGTLYNNNSVDIAVTFKSEDFPLGNYSMDMKIASNDTLTPNLIVPVKMIIQNPLTLNFTGIIEGLYNGTVMVEDTITIGLHRSVSPYSLFELKKMYLNASGIGTANFNTVIEGTPYYLVLKHRNGLETWSAFPQTFSGGSLTYDFTTSQSQAFGNNLKLKEGKWCIYSGDVNGDGAVDLSDIISIINSANSFTTGSNLVTDLNGDGSVDLDDIIIVINNSNTFISKQTP